jgi:signal transduction histidine kinase
MQLAPIPRNDEDRLRALASLDILDTIGEESYQAIVRLASLICGTEISCITLVDRDRQWFKASVNLGVHETPRDISFCGHAIVQNGPLVVEDAALDPRFHDNPLVTNAPFVRFYAGQRVLTPEGFAVGTVCVFGPEPRTLSPAQLDALGALATQTSALLELRLRVRDLQAEVQERKQAEFAADIARRVADEARQEAEAATRAKSEFLARMSHELRTPLNAIIGFSGVLQKNRAGVLSTADLSFLERISANGQHLLQLINDILDLAKVEAGQDEITFGAVDLAALVGEMVGELQGRVITDGRPGPVELTADVPAGLVGIESDRLRLKQILINLVGNALKFTKSGSVTVRVVAGESGVPMRVDVTDTGIGIPAERLAAIFKAFEQADRDTALIYGGTGLGLAISSTLAERLGYHISVESTVGVGSTFSVHMLPAWARRAA